MSLSRKHFRKLAGIVNESLPSEATHSSVAKKDRKCQTLKRNVVLRIARDIAVMCKTENSNFEYATFYTACGMTDREADILENGLPYRDLSIL